MPDLAKYKESLSFYPDLHENFEVYSGLRPILHPSLVEVRSEVFV